MKISLHLYFLVVMSLVAFFQPTLAANAILPLGTQTTAPFPEIIDQSALKESVNPCEDFYQFACGSWIEQTPIPPEKTGINRQTTAMTDSVDLRLNQILEAYVRGDFQTPATEAVRLANFYTSCMTLERQPDESIKLIKSEITKIQETHSAEDVASLLAQFQLNGISGFFGVYSMPDYNDSSRIILDVSQGGMGLNNPAYYLNQDVKSVEIRQKYTEYIASLFQLIGMEIVSSHQTASRILQIETSLAQKAYSMTDQSDPDKVKHLMGLQDLKTLMPHFRWDSYFQSLGLNPIDLNVDEPEFFANLDTVLARLSKKDRDNYLIWSLLNKTSSKMGGNFETTSFSFWSTYMNGAAVMAPRWKVCTQATEKFLGYALAEAYVRTLDGEAIKVKTNDMIDQIKETFLTDLTLLSTGLGAWIDGSTMTEAINKTKAIARKVGGPEKLRDYSSLQISSTSYLENWFRISSFESHRDLAKIGQPVDQSEWDMMPWEVNAYYDRSKNEFIFPFGILQPPSLDLTASDGANYGAFGGGTIGHELTHGFDNNGSKFDSHGNLKNWWSPKTQDNFNKKAQCFIDQANAYKITSVGLNVNGEQTLEENLADQGGVRLGYLALTKILSTRPEGPKWLGKYSERQQYWVAYAQSWCSKYTDASLRSQMTNDEHPPAEFRVNAVLLNQPEFAVDFSCASQSRMSPVNRCSIW